MLISNSLQISVTLLITYDKQEGPQLGGGGGGGKPRTDETPSLIIYMLYITEIYKI